MKNKIKVLVLLIIFSGSYACEDVLDRKPLDKISDENVWKDQSLMEAYIFDLYALLPSRYWIDEYHYTDEGTGSSPNTNAMTQGSMDKNNTVGNLEYWDYSVIRRCNVFLENMDGAPLTDAVKKKFEGEVRAMRAFSYFEMVKRYGGVPLVTEVLDPRAPIEPENQQRATEVAIHDFIDTEYAAAIELLEQTAAIKPTARINKWTVLALKARSNLYAASIAKYGSVQIDGIVGVPASRANEFFEKASDAAEQVINSGLYSLYQKHDDLGKNYQYIFLDEGNSEIIFAREYNGIEVKHNWDYWKAPNNFCSGQGSRANPLVELMLSYENIDGSVEDYTQYFGPGNLWDDAHDLFKRKDPRMFGTVLMQGSLFQNYAMQFYDGIDTGTDPNPANIVSSTSLKYQGYPQIGIDSRLTIGDDRNTNSGLLIRKWCDEPKLPIPQETSQVDWVIMRLAEVWLTHAEAEFQLGRLPQAATSLNKTRERAGISLLDETTISLPKIQNEWMVEFAFENKRFWDLRRWRIAEDVLNHPMKGMSTIWHFASNKYYFLLINAEGFNRVFRPEHYYNPISTSRLNNNVLLVQNPLY